MVGLGLGVWAIDDTLQGTIIMQAVAQVLDAITLQNISDIDFSWFPQSCTECGGATNGAVFRSDNGNSIKIHIPKIIRLITYLIIKFTKN